MGKRGRFIGLVIGLALLAGSVVAKVELPVYTARQLRNPAFVQAEVKRFEEIRLQLIRDYDTASPIMRAVLRGDDERVEMALEMLRYVEKNGFLMEDPALRGMSYFTFSPFPESVSSKSGRREYQETTDLSPASESEPIGKLESKSDKSEEISRRLPVDGVEPLREGRSSSGKSTGETEEDPHLKESILALILSLLIFLGIIFSIWTAVLMLGLRFVGGENLGFREVLGTVLRIILPAWIPCAGLILVGWIINRRHETGWGGAIVACLVAYLLMCVIVFTVMLLTGQWPHSSLQGG
jgi:hypothetical protein